MKGFMTKNNLNRECFLLTEGQGFFNKITLIAKLDWCPEVTWLFCMKP